MASKKINPYELQRVILAPVSDELQLDENFEPPFVRVRDTNSQFIEIDTSEHDAFSNPCELIVTLSRAMPRVNRVKVSFFSFRNFSPNINPRNNVITFVDNAINYSITLQADQNLTGLVRYQYLAAQMNLATGNAGEFIAAVNADFPLTYNIVNTLGRLFRFTYVGNGITRGRYLWGFNERNYNVATEATEHFLTSYTENYTRYVDIASNEITRYSKIDISGTNIPAEVLIRVGLTSIAYGAELDVEYTIPPSINYERSRSISSIDIAVLDEFKQVLYVPPQLWGSYILYLAMIASM